MIELDKSLSTLVDKLNELVASNSGDAINLALTMTKIDCIQGVCTMVLLAVLSVATYFVAAWACKKGIKIEAEAKKDWKHSDDSSNYYFVMAIFCAISIVLAFVALSMLTDVYMWIGLVDPKIALAKKIMLTVLK